jgi:predicted HicB family RNase H-like nuclease
MKWTRAQACVRIRGGEDDNVTIMKYEGYEARVKYDEEAEIFHGEVINVRDIITFQARSEPELTSAFAASVEDYLAFCGERGEEPDRGRLARSFPS